MVYKAPVCDDEAHRWARTLRGHVADDALCQCGAYPYAERENLLRDRVSGVGTFVPRCGAEAPGGGWNCDESMGHAGAHRAEDPGHVIDGVRVRRVASWGEDELVCWECGTTIVTRPDGAEKPCGHTGAVVVTRDEWERVREPVLAKERLEKLVNWK